MGLEIFPSQKKLLVQEALLFEEAVKNVGSDRKAKSITWDSPEELEAYIQRVQGAADLIVYENQRLKALHQRLVELISTLFDVNLIKQRAVWKERIEQARRLIEQGCQGRSAQLCGAWKIHWDV